MLTEFLSVNGKPVLEGTLVKFVGYPSYKQGLKGCVSYVSEFNPEVVKVQFLNGTEMITDVFQLEVL